MGNAGGGCEHKQMHQHNRHMHKPKRDADACMYECRVNMVQEKEKAVTVVGMEQHAPRSLKYT